MFRKGILGTVCSLLISMIVVIAVMRWLGVTWEDVHTFIDNGWQEASRLFGMTKGLATK